MKRGIGLVVLLLTGACQAGPPSAGYARQQPGRPAAERAALRQDLVGRLDPGRPPEAAAVTVDACIADALARSPAVEAAIRRWNAAAAQVDVVTEYPDPVLTLSYMPDPIETRLGPTRARVGVMQRIPWPGRLDARGRAQAAAAEVARLAVRALAWRLATDVRLAYADLLDLDRDTALLEAQVILLEGWRDLTTAQLELGHARTSDMIQIDIRQQRLQEAIANNVERRQAILARLNALRSRPGATPLVPVEPRDPEAALDIDALLAAARERNPEVERLRQAHRAACAGIRLADLNRYTDPTVGVEYTIVDEGPLRQFPDNGEDSVGISVSIPIPWRQRGRYAERLAARMSAAAAAQEEEAGWDRVRGDVAAALHALREARSRQATFRDRILPLVEREVEVGLQEYATQRATMTDLLKYEAERLGVLQDLRRATTRAWKERARLEHAVGARLGPAPGAAPPPSPPTPAEPPR